MPPWWSPPTPAATLWVDNAAAAGLNCGVLSQQHKAIPVVHGNENQRTAPPPTYLATQVDVKSYPRAAEAILSCWNFGTHAFRVPSSGFGFS